MLALASRLLTGVAPWRSEDAAARAVRGWVEASIDAVHDADEPGAPVLVALRHDRIAGFVTTGTRQHWSGDVDAYVGELVVAEDLAGQGIGQSLMSSAEQWARSAGYTRLTIETGAGNRTARQFYTALGYLEEEVVLSQAL
ncbi:MAG: GNAT family N-acetyltransferase [Actinomycetota bacterium]|nr:GNAT family N-acetyltransferase [Actinomycetota bacterium]